MVLVSHDDGSTELVTVQDTSSPATASYQDMSGGGLEIESLPNTPSPCPSLEVEDSPDSPPSGQSVHCITTGNNHRDRLSNLNCHLEMIDLTQGNPVTDKVPTIPPTTYL